MLRWREGGKGGRVGRGGRLVEGGETKGGGRLRGRLGKERWVVRLKLRGKGI